MRKIKYRLKETTVLTVACVLRSRAYIHIKPTMSLGHTAGSTDGEFKLIMIITHG